MKTQSEGTLERERTHGHQVGRRSPPPGDISATVFGWRDSMPFTPPDLTFEREQSRLRFLNDPGRAQRLGRRRTPSNSFGYGPPQER